jgi:hypothetical protein
MKPEVRILPVVVHNHRVYERLCTYILRPRRQWPQLATLTQSNYCYHYTIESSREESRILSFFPPLPHSSIVVSGQSAMTKMRKNERSERAEAAAEH